LLIGIVLLGIYFYKPNPSQIVKEKIVTKVWVLKDVPNEISGGNVAKDVEYGYRLLSETSKWIGPMAEDPKKHFSGNNMSCTNCHLKAGTQAGSASWVGVTNRFPQYNGRSNKDITIEDRINGCMERSMNGKKLPEKSEEMKAMVAYMAWISEDLPKEREEEFNGYPDIEIPNIAVNLETGKDLFTKQCMICHGANGQGILLTDGSKGYQFPPLWGDDSYNDGAGMHRVLTAAQFIKGNMPFGQASYNKPILTDEEAYHLAGYINSFDRPKMKNTAADYPDLKKKPVSTSYGPWADNFSAEQHKYGPFPPIINYYKEKYDMNKTK
jgi:thiosulfate dehydrogenase